MYDINTVLSTRRSFGEWKISVETQWPQTPATELLLSQVMCAGWCSCLKVRPMVRCVHH